MKRIIAMLISGLLLSAATVSAAPAKTVVKEAEVRKVIGDFLKNRTSGLDLELNIKKIGYSGDLALPSGAIAYEVVAPRQWEGWGNANLALIVRVDDRVERNIPVRVEVEALANMLVTVRPLERGEVVRSVDVALQKRDLAGAGGRICRTVEEAVGLRVKTGLRANAPLRSDALEKVPLVKSGQMVTILLENPAIRITAAGQSKDSGAEGDIVMVRNVNSQKYIPARVLDANTVSVEF